jgi:hypothetical protein
MTVSTPAELKVGDEVHVAGRRARVVAVTGAGAELEDVTGARLVFPLAELFTDPGFTSSRLVGRRFLRPGCWRACRSRWPTRPAGGNGTSWRC